MKGLAKRLLPRELHAYLRPAYQTARRWLRKLDHAWDRRTLMLPRFTRVLGDLGITAGATVMVHSSMDDISRRVPELDAVRLVRLLQDLLGPEGTLLMPTFPFVGAQLRYADTHDTFDTHRTPSRVGLATEVFRRMPGVIRSLHPTHPIAGWGKHAQELLDTHHLGTAFGRHSPLYKLCHRQGLVIGLGAGLSSFTILHVAEELHAPTRAVRFEPEARAMTIIDGGRRIPYALEVLKVGIDYDFDRLAGLLAKNGTLKRVSRSGLQCASARADRLIEGALELLEQQAFFAPTWSLMGGRRPMRA